MTSFSIILVNYNGSKFLHECLNSIQKFGEFNNWEVIIVDNASTDNSISIIINNFPSFKLICSHTNWGFSKANNLAVRSSQGEYLLFLNTDTILTKNTPEVLLNHLNLNKNIGIISPRITFENGRYQLSCGDLPNLLSEFIDKIRYAFDNEFYDFLSTFYDRQYSKVQEVGWVTGACMMMRRDVFEQIDGFDENFFMYFEDKDICKRVKDLGYKVVYYPETTIIHLLGGSSHGIKKSVNKYYRDSQLYYYQKHLGKFQTNILKLYLKLSGKV
ncbi:glycosyltransferase family 2 protein [Pseudanabaena biceps]|nr:glycosyltransferase family 2 protein [Pseudanabaena biceps]